MAKSIGAAVETKDGKIEGINQDGLYVFKGIPYAAPPSGERRWLPPQPVEGWSGIRQAKSFGPAASQSQVMGFLESLETYRVSEASSEDCLYLNVWSPGLDLARRPVLFWIHGGGFGSGSGAVPLYNGKSLATRGNVVVVTINYRLGLLGFLNLREVTTGRIPSTGNEGLLDQIAALEWVRDNIASFGGDPNNVTIFGESAGGASVGCLLAMPRARGLFQKAILESGGANSCAPLDRAVGVAEEFLKSLGLQASDVDALRSLPVKRILEIQRQLTLKFSSEGRSLPMRPQIDGNLISEMPIISIEHGSAKEIPVLMGTTLEEWKLMCNSSISPDLPNLEEAGLKIRCRKYAPAGRIDNLVKTYREALAKRGVANTPADIWVAIQTDGIGRIPAIRLAEAQRRNNPSVYCYLFTWKSPQPLLGACHALEIGFVFGTYDEIFCGKGPGADELSRKIQDGWLAFAHNGDPSCESLGKWLPYTERRETMILGSKCYLEEIPYTDERRAWDFVSNATWLVP